jgi:hypothetical protein
MPRRITRNAQIPRNEWSKFFDQFVQGSEGHLVDLETFGTSIGDEHLVRSVPLLSINYDPRDKGDLVMISTGHKEVQYEHQIPSPKEVWVEQGSLGDSQAMEIISENGNHTVVSFKQ